MPELMQYRAGEMVRQARTASIRAVESQDRVLDFVLSTQSRDRYNSEVIGWKLKNYRANPAIAWAHSYSIPLIGNALRVGVDADKRLVVRAEFTPEEINPFGFSVYRSYAEGWMRTWSAGFIPEAVEYVENEDPTAEKKGQRRGFYRLTKNDLLEGSAVPIPANAECTTLALMERGVIARAFEPMVRAQPVFSSDMTPEAYAQETEKFVKACKALTEWNGEKLDVAKKRVLEFFAKRAQKCEVVEGEWNYGDHACRNCGATDDASHALDCEHSRTAAEVEREARKAAEAKATEQRRLVVPSAAARGPLPYKKQKTAKPDADWSAQREVAKASVDDLFEMAAWYDGEGTKKADYRFVHHEQAGYVTNLKGVQRAMAGLASGREAEGVTSGDKAKAYRHLAMHYKEFDVEAPSLKAMDDKGAWQNCTPEAFFERAAEADIITEMAEGNAGTMTFSRSIEGSNDTTALCSMQFDARAMADAIDGDAKDRATFLSACEAAWDCAESGERTVVEEALVSATSRTIRTGYEKRASATILAAVVRAVLDVEEKPAPDPMLCGFSTVLREAREKVGRSVMDVAAMLPLTASQVEGLETMTRDTLRDPAEATRVTGQVEAVATALGIDLATVREALAKDTEVASGAAVRAALDEAQARLTDAMAMLRAAVAGTPLPEGKQAATTRSEGDDDGDDDNESSPGMVAKALDVFLRGGTVDAAQKIIGKGRKERDAKDDDKDGTQHQRRSTVPSVTDLASAFGPGAK